MASAILQKTPQSQRPFSMLKGMGPLLFLLARGHSPDASFLTARDSALGAPSIEDLCLHLEALDST